MPDVRAEFEETISLLTQPLNGQYPRPWMTNLTNPQEADVFIVGKNQRNGYDCARLGSHDRHLNALFNRNSETCRKVYNEMTAGKASPTRKNTDRFVKILASKGVHNILETNVICYSTPMSADLRLGQHSGGEKRGEEIFRYLLTAINPKVLIVHGSGSAIKLASILCENLDREPTHAEDLCLTPLGNLHIFAIPSLAPPAFNRWSSWADQHFDLVADAVKAILF